MEIDKEGQTDAQNVADMFSGTGGGWEKDSEADSVCDDYSTLKTEYRIEPDNLDRASGFDKSMMHRLPEAKTIAWKAFHHMRPLIEKRYGSPFEKYELIQYTKAFISGIRYNVKIMISETEYIHAAIRHIKPKGAHEELQLVYLMCKQTFEDRLDFGRCKLIIDFRQNYSKYFNEYKVSNA
jgi:hypothetical protein